MMMLKYIELWIQMPVNVTGEANIHPFTSSSVWIMNNIFYVLDLEYQEIVPVCCHDLSGVY